MTTALKTTILLESSRDWEEWYEVVRSIAQARGILSLIDIDEAAEQPEELKPVEPQYTNVNEEATSYADLNADEKDHYKVLMTEYRTRLERFDKQRKALVDILELIQSTVARNLRPYIRGLSSPFEILKALKKRLAPTDRTRRLELARDYQALKKAPRAQQIEKWLLQWETTYAEAEKLKLADIQDNKALYDFILAIKSIDPAYASAYQVHVDTKLEDDFDVPTLYDAVERFRNNIRLSRATSKSSSYATFATFQGEAQGEPSAELSSNEPQAEPRETSRRRRGCVCGQQHSFYNCPYIVKQKRPIDWVPNAQIQEDIKKKMANSSRLKNIINSIRRRAKYREHTNSEPRLTAEPQKEQALQRSTSSTTLTNFAVDQGSYKLRDTWILDSGSDTHVCNNRSRFKFERMATDDDKLIAGKTIYSIEAFGSVEITLQAPTGPKRIILHDVALAPGFFTNTASLNRFLNKGVHWDTENQRLHHNGTTFCQVQRVNRHWALEYNPIPSSEASRSAFASSKAPQRENEGTADRWHALLGHPGHDAVAHIQQSTKGTIVTGGPTISTCETCALSKAQQIISRRSIKEDPAEEPLARVAYDLIQMAVAYNKDKWVSHFRCCYTGMDFVYTHPKKSQSVDIITEFLNMAKNRYSRSIRYFRTDRETSLGNRFKELVAAKGITPERSAPATPAQNGAAERSGGVIVTKARCIRIAALLPANLWPEIVQAAAYLNNRTPKRQLQWKTPFEALTKIKPNLSHLRVYGCRAYPLNKHIPRSQKLQPRALIRYLTGYDSTNIYQIWVPSQEKIIRTRDVTFNESLFYDPAELDIGHLRENHKPPTIEILEHSYHKEEEREREVEDDINTLFDLSPSTDSPYHGTANSSNDDDSSTIAMRTPCESATSSLNPSEQLLTPNTTPDPINAPSELSATFDTRNILPEGIKRTRVSSRRIAYAAALSQTSGLSSFHTAFATGINRVDGAKIQGQHRDTLPTEPRSWKQMLKHPFAANFKLAANKEIRELEKKGTYKWVSRAGIKTTPLPMIWVFKYKFDINGYLTKFKVRLCVRGDLQSTEQDTYAATLAARTFRALLAIAAAFDLEIRQYDAINAFVNSRLNEEIHCYSPEGYEQLGKCWQLLRALYGLKQAPLLWYNDFTMALEELGLQSIPGVNCLFANNWLLLFFYVDDIAALYRKENQAQFEQFESKLLQRFEMRSIGELKWFLGIRIERERSTRKLWLCQDSYIAKIAAKFKLDLNAKAPKTPLPYEELRANDSDEPATPQQILAYQQRVGSVNFAAVITRVDIAHAASKLAQFLKNPSPAHLHASNQAILYLWGTRGFAIEYSGQTTAQIFECSSDAAFADDIATRRSSDGFLFRLYGGAIDWRAARQRTVTTSSTEAELLSISTAAREVLWWKRFFEAIHFNTQQHIKINCDNLQTIRILTKEALKLDTKLRHIDIHQHWLRQEVQAGRIAVQWLPTAEMPADGLTKALPRQKHEAFVKQLNLVDISNKLGGNGGSAVITSIHTSAQEGAEAAEATEAEEVEEQQQIA